MVRFCAPFLNDMEQQRRTLPKLNGHVRLNREFSVILCHMELLEYFCRDVKLLMRFLYFHIGASVALLVQRLNLPHLTCVCVCVCVCVICSCVCFRREQSGE